jgi:hypothetical protein
LAPATSTAPARESSSRRRSWSVPQRRLHAALRLGAAGRDRDDPELDEGPAHLAERACLVPGPPAAGQGRLEAAVPVAVDRAREPRPEGDCPEELEVPRRVLLDPEDRGGDASGGVVDRAEERDLRPSGSQPVCGGSSRAGGAGPRPPSARAGSGGAGPGAGGARDPLRPQDPPDARAGQRDPLPLREQLGEVGVVGSGIAAPREGEQPLPHRVGDPVPARPAPVGVDEPGRTRRPEPRQQAPEMALGTPECRGRVPGCQFARDDAGQGQRSTLLGDRHRDRLHRRRLTKSLNSWP